MAFPPPKDMPTEYYQKAKDTKVFVYHPPRIFHLRPQFVQYTPSDDWEKTFLHQKVSVPRMKAEYLAPLRFPGLDVRVFPDELYEVRRNFRHVHPDDQAEVSITWAKQVLNYVEPEAEVRHRTASRYNTPPSGGPAPQDDLRVDAIAIIRYYANGGWKDAVTIYDQLAEREYILAELNMFVRFRDHNGVPNGLGYRPSQDTLYLDNQYLEDYLERVSRDASPFNKLLVPFLNGVDRTKISNLAISIAPFLNANVVSTACHAVIQTFPNLSYLRLVTLAVVDRKPEQWWEADTRFAHLQSLEGVVEREARMASRRRAPASGPPPASRCPVSDFAVAAGLMLDPDGPEIHHRSLTPPAARAASPEDPFVGPGPVPRGQDPAPAAAEPVPYDWPPLLHTIHQEMKKARRAVVTSTIMQADIVRRAQKAERNGTPTKLPSPQAGGRSAVGASPRTRRARFERERNERLGSARDLVPERENGDYVRGSMLIDPDHASLIVEPVIMCYYRDAFDRATRGGWGRHGPMLDLGHLDM